MEQEEGLYLDLRLQRGLEVGPALSQKYILNNIMHRE